MHSHTPETPGIGTDKHEETVKTQIGVYTVCQAPSRISDRLTCRKMSSTILLLRPLEIKTTPLLRPAFVSPICFPTKWHIITKTRLFKYIENFTSKNLKFSDKKIDIFHISAQNIDCGHSLEPPRRGGSNEYPQSMFLSRNKKNNAYPCKPQVYYIKVGFKGVKII